MGIYQTGIPNLKKCSRGQVKQHFSRHLWVDGIPSHQGNFLLPFEHFSHVPAMLDTGWVGSLPSSSLVV